MILHHAKTHFLISRTVIDIRPAQHAGALVCRRPGESSNFMRGIEFSKNSNEILVMDEYLAILYNII